MVPARPFFMGRPGWVPCLTASERGDDFPERDVVRPAVDCEPAPNCFLR
jgi:hypothetical protein